MCIVYTLWFPFFFVKLKGHGLTMDWIHFLLLVTELLLLLLIFFSFLLLLTFPADHFALWQPYMAARYIFDSCNDFTIKQSQHDFNKLQNLSSNFTVRSWAMLKNFLKKSQQVQPSLTTHAFWLWSFAGSCLEDSFDLLLFFITIYFDMVPKHCKYIKVKKPTLRQ